MPSTQQWSIEREREREMYRAFAKVAPQRGVGGSSHHDRNRKMHGEVLRKNKRDHLTG